MDSNDENELNRIFGKINKDEKLKKFLLGPNGMPSPDLLEKLIGLNKVMEEFNGQMDKMLPPEKPVPPKFALFYGFNGILAKKYSKIEDKTEAEIRARMSMLKLKTPLAWSIYRWEDFEKIVVQFAGGPNALIEILFEDAMSIIRNGEKNEFERFIETETEEFTDKCIPGKCKPGNHFCGK